MIKLDDFLSQRRQDNAGDYEYRSGWGNSEDVVIASDKPGSAMMFQDFAGMVENPEWKEASIRVSERTQYLLDAIWDSAVGNEKA